ncbi:uncharacterized protein LOC126264263 isoform X1 [Aethina tumida]|uniref:uncharacterized protein LOC126264263 isoform X1 n=1 Tax=Aethina tumida TaxID=116153 RepID=UPI00214782DD|nr:uncharacterized protein LOC126264263 isoform X1 [Aethina tumida]XP_049817224.1 uncharacterized protein LOC126264263 isoform X1 [Aethina tumida]
MGGCRCSYKNCTNSTKSAENIHFFHYPVRHKERCKIWIENANKPQFCDLEEDQLRNKVICAVHFENKYFPNPQKKRLLQGAIPTLDGDAEETVGITNQLLVQDVQVLPANDDGTLFVLETDIFNRMNRTKEVESFIYKNGIMVPSRLAKNTDKTGSENDNALHHVLDTKEFEVVTQPQKKVVNANNAVSITPLSQPKKILNKILDKSGPAGVLSTQIKTAPSNFVIKTENTYEKDEITHEEIHIIDDKMVEDDMGVPEETSTPVKSSAVKTSTTKLSPDVSVGRIYLRKIKQHSRDIATIKRMLKQKKLLEPDNSAILNTLKGKLPPTLYTIVELQLQNTISANDIEFFTNFHNTSPEAYNLLRNKYNWALPDLNDISECNSA